MAINTRNRAPIPHPVTDSKAGDRMTRPWVAWAQGVDASITAVVGSGVTTANPLPANELVLGDGANAIKSLGSLGTTTTVYHGNAAGAGTFGPINLTAGAEVTGDLPYANLAQGTGLSVLGVTGNATADNASIVAGSDHQVVRRSGTAVGFGAINLASSDAVSGILAVANGGTGVSALFSPVLMQPVTIVNADIKKLTNTAYLCIAAPASGSRIKIIAVTFYTNFTNGAYTGVDTTYATLQLQTSSFGNWLISPILNDNGAPVSDLTTFVSAQAQTWDLLAPAVFPTLANGWMQYTTGTSQAAVDAAAVNLFLDNNGSATDLGGGHALNTLKLRIYYVVESLG